jgi:hypothetical protein
MARPLRLEHEGAFWHVTSRGNERKNIFRSDADRLLFLCGAQKVSSGPNLVASSW